MSSKLDSLRELLYGWPHEGMVRAGRADPFSGFLLVAARIDALASLAYESEKDDHKGGRRYARFVTECFPKPYRRRGLPKILWSDLRSAPLHFLSSSGHLALADSQPDANLHLAVDEHERVILHWPEFLRDFEAARDRLWDRITQHPPAKARALAALRTRPQLRVQEIRPALALPANLPASFPSSVASAYLGPVITGQASTASIPVTGGPTAEQGA